MMQYDLPLVGRVVFPDMIVALDTSERGELLVTTENHMFFFETLAMLELWAEAHRG